MKPTAWTAKQFLNKVLIGVVSFIGVMFFWLGWGIYQAYHTSTITQGKNLQIAQLRGAITYLDEVLTMSARMAAASGERRWEERYRHFEPQLDSAIQESIGLVPEVSRDQTVGQTDAANRALVEMEHRAFDLVNQGRRDEAQALLASAEYERYKKLYAEGMHRFSALMEESIAASQLAVAQRNIWSMVSISGIAVLLVAGWLSSLIYIHRRHQQVAALQQGTLTSLIDVSVQQVREAVLQMKNPEDWSEVGVVLRRQLHELMVFDGAGIAIVNRDYRNFYAYSLTESGALRGEVCEFLPRALDQAIATGKPVLRRNRAEMEAWGDNIGLERNSVVDVPFGQGTIALSSAREDAFSGWDIEVLEHFAEVIAEAYLRLEFFQQLKRFSAIIEESTDFIGMCDPQGRMLYLNQAGRKMVGVGEDEDITLTRATDYLPACLHGIVSTVASQGVWQGEGALRRRDGSEIPVLYTALAHRGVDGKVEILSSIARDISERQRAEEGTRVSLALQQVRNAILQMKNERDWLQVATVFDQQLRPLTAHQYSSINMVDRVRGKVLAHSVGPKNLPEEIVLDYLPRALVEAMGTGKPVYRRNQREIEGYGDQLGALGSVVDAPFAGGTIALSATNEDAFSEHNIQVLEQFAQMMNEGYQRLEDLKTLALQGEQLHQAQKLEAIGQLATGVAHEINNPLTSVLGYSELLLRRELAPEVREHLETIHQEGERAREIGARLLQFVRRQKANLQSLSLNLLVEEVLTLVRQQFELDHVQLVAELAEGLPPLDLHPGQLQQLLLALLQNSREAIQKTGKAGEIKVQTRQQGAWVRLTVEDDGPGIPAQFREKIFEPFFTTKEVGSAAGTGMGLSLCFAIAREHGGHLWAEARTAGTGMVLELPVRDRPGESSSTEEKKDAS